MRISKIESLIAFSIPLPVFIEPGSPYVLASSRLAEGATAFPLSLFFLPIALLIAFVNMDYKFRVRTLAFNSSIFLFCIWVFVLGVMGLSNSLKSMLFAFQWVVPFLWLPYMYLVFAKENKKRVFLKYFSHGVIFSVVYLFLSGVLEIVFYGHLQDAGRVTQNLIFIGQYQLYVYTPTILAYGIITYNWIAKSGYIKVNPIWILFFNLLSFLTLLFLGAREAILIYILGVFSFLAINNKKGFFVVCVSSFVIISAMFSLTGTKGVAGVEVSDLRAINKIISLREEGKGLGGRDLMVRKYVSVINDDVLFGSHMLPPEISKPWLNVNAPSAHNYYVDVFGWSGVLGAILNYFAILVILVNISIFIVRAALFKVVFEPLKMGVVILLFLFFLVSNNINVPLRQPLTGAYVAFLIAYFFSNRLQAK